MNTGGDGSDELTLLLKSLVNNSDYSERGLPSNTPSLKYVQPGDTTHAAIDGGGIS